MGVWSLFGFSLAGGDGLGRGLKEVGDGQQKMLSDPLV